MKKSPDEVKSFEQPMLFPGGPVTLTMRVGIFPEADHAQFQLEVHTAGGHELLFLEARPHVDWCQVDAELSEWVRRLREQIRVHADPFP